MNYLNAIGIRVKMRPVERATFYASWRDKKLRGIFLTASGNSGNALVVVFTNVWFRIPEMPANHSDFVPTTIYHFGRSTAEWASKAANSGVERGSSVSATTGSSTSTISLIRPGRDVMTATRCPR